MIPIAPNHADKYLDTKNVINAVQYIIICMTDTVLVITRMMNQY